MEITRTSLGIPELDDLLNGGILQGDPLLVSGRSGSGKTMLALQYLLHSAQKGERGVYICIDDTPSKLMKISKAIGWDFEPLLKSGSVSFLDVTQYFSTEHMINAPLSVDRLVDNILQFAQDKRITRACIDPCLPLCFLAQSKSDICYYIRKLLFRLQDYEWCTPLLTLNTDFAPWVSSYMSSLVSGSIDLNHGIHESRRRLVIQKMSGTAVPIRQMAYDIIPKRGVVIRSG